MGREEQVSVAQMEVCVCRRDMQSQESRTPWVRMEGSQQSSSWRCLEPEARIAAGLWSRTEGHWQCRKTQDENKLCGSW